MLLVEPPDTVDVCVRRCIGDTEAWRESGGLMGFVTSAMMASCLPPPSPHGVLLACGPPPMLQHAVAPAAEALGYSSAAPAANRYFQF